MPGACVKGRHGEEIRSISTKIFGRPFDKKSQRRKATSVAEKNGVAKSTLKVFGEAFYKKLRRKQATSVAEENRDECRGDYKLLLLPKVAQKHRTASLSGAECAKSKTNASRPKHLASLFLDAFALSARRDCTSQSLVRRRCKVRTL